MPCFHPINIPKKGFVDLRQVVACGRCKGCRIDRSQAWAIRCVHEASLHEDNCFITLTYNDEHLPAGGSLQLEDFQKFMKRFRKRCGNKVSFFHCGEYGEQAMPGRQLGRPHYHALIFGADLPDKVPFKRTGHGVLYSSATLDSLWGKGFTTVGACTFETAAYCARYVMKKITGDRAVDHYQGVVAEYATMSRRPAIGKRWFGQFSEDVFPDDFVVVRGTRKKVPRFYDRELKRVDESRLFTVKGERASRRLSRLSDSTPRRLAEREEVFEARITSLKRSL